MLYKLEQRLKKMMHRIKREVESLKSKCAYCVAGSVIYIYFFSTNFNYDIYD